MTTTRPSISDLFDTQLIAGRSDLFITTGKPPRVRTNGQVQETGEPTTSKEEMEEFISKLLSEPQRKVFKESGDLDVGYTSNSGDRYRLNLSKQIGSTSIVARILPKCDLSFEELKLPKSVQDLANMTRGLVLVTGATGSGKSTTLATMINHINKTRACHIVTIEDPIEFLHEDIKSTISQREVGADTVSFQSALRHVVRQSPDVILVGEMRDTETIQVALSAALTGHLVLATLHTIDATQTLQRILSDIPENQKNQTALDLSLSLKGVICQRLLPSRHGGMVVATEIMTHTAAVAQLLKAQRISELEDLMRTSQSGGMHTFNDSLLALHRAGEISLETGRAFATNPDQFNLSTLGMSTASMPNRESDSDGVVDVDLHKMLQVAVAKGASDLHLSVGRPPMLRITGKITPMSLRPLSDADMRALLFTILSARQRSRYELERELDFALSIEGGRRFRVNAYFQQGHMAAALRAIPVEIPSAVELNVPESILSLVDKPHGLLLMVGPTGSGKTTTLACLVDRINKNRACRIITIEDPIEYLHKPHKATVEQREVGSDTHSIAGALKYILRQDPDVILIGEMRDYEAISSAITAAETGHLVLATLHTNDAPQAIDRIIDAFPSHQQDQARMQLASSLLGVVSQRLVPRANGKGRLPVVEVMVGTLAIRNLIREQRMHQAVGVMEGSLSEGNITIDRALKELLHRGEITYESAERIARNPKSIEGFSKRPIGGSNDDLKDTSGGKKRGFW
jgi:pilus retraction protein PilT